MGCPSINGSVQQKDSTQTSFGLVSTGVVVRFNPVQLKARCFCFFLPKPVVIKMGLMNIVTCCSFWQFVCALFVKKTKKDSKKGPNTQVPAQNHEQKIRKTKHAVGPQKEFEQ